MVIDRKAIPARELLFILTDLVNIVKRKSSRERFIFSNEAVMHPCIEVNEIGIDDLDRLIVRQLGRIANDIELIGEKQLGIVYPFGIVPPLKTDGQGLAGVIIQTF